MRPRTRKFGWVGLLAVFSLLTLSSAAPAQELLDGNWKLVMRKLQDGTTLVPPTVQGITTGQNGLWTRVVFWRTPEGKQASFAGVSNRTVSETEWTETLLFSVLDDGSGKGPVYNLIPKTASAPVSREGGRVMLKLPFDPPSLVIEGDKSTATAPGMFVDYWERIR
jgi:hypothetical protein